MKIFTLIFAMMCSAFACGQSGYMNLEPETRMTISAGKVNTANLKMESGASLLENGNLVFAPAATTQIRRYMTGNGIDPSTALWHYVASPVTLGTANTFYGCLLNKYNEPTQTWQAIYDTATPLAVAKGYSTALPDTADVIFTGGIPNFGDKTFTGLTYTGNVINYSGWHLLGNPFPCAVDWTLPGWDRINIDATVYTYDGSQYKFYTYPNQGPPYGNMTNGIIPAEQGFMVKVSSPGTGSITIPQGARVHSSQGFYKSSVPDMLELEITGNGYEDQMLIHFDRNATEGFDAEYDAFKLFGIEKAPQLYSMIPGIRLAGNVLSSVDENPLVQVGLQVGEQNSYTITVSGIESFATGTSVFLEDLQLDKTIKLNDAPVYTFNAAPGDAEHRFNLHFNLAGLEEPGTNSLNIRIYSYGNDVYVSFPFEFDGEIMIYTMLGSLVEKVPVKNNPLVRIPLSTDTGYYVVNVTGDKGTRTAKVFIQ